MPADTVLGIDPGLSGALAFLGRDGTLLEVVDMPTMTIRVGKKDQRHVNAALLASACRLNGIRTVVVEDVRSSPQMGVTSAFNFGVGKGTVLGVVAALGLSLVLVPPTRWITDLRLAKQGKDAHRARATELWPNVADWFARPSHDGRADAALLAYWHLTHEEQL